MNSATERKRETIVIVGNGMVGHAFCKKLVSRDLNKSFQVVVLGEENSPAYDRVNLTKDMNATSA